MTAHSEPRCLRHSRRQINCSDLIINTPGIWVQPTSVRTVLGSLHAHTSVIRTADSRSTLGDQGERRASKIDCAEVLNEPLTIFHLVPDAACATDAVR